MWIISKTGFVSVVQHQQDPSLMRARARRRDHLVNTFGLGDEEVIDLGPGANDYRWHADVTREHVKLALASAVNDVDYDSHVKEAVTGGDEVFYTAMIKSWGALRKLQS
jgi:hypothetical protein